MIATAVANGRRRYSKRQKATAVIAAAMSTVEAASEQTGIPQTNIRRWRDDPEMAEYGAKAREEIAEEVRALSVKVLAEIRTKLPDFEPRDLSVLFGILTEKSQLLAGEATARTETREVAGQLNDQERESLRALLDSALQEATVADGD